MLIGNFDLTPLAKQRRPRVSTQEGREGTASLALKGNLTLRNGRYDEGYTA